MGYVIEQQTYETLPTGDYSAEISRVELEEGQFGQQLKFSFDLLGEKEGRTLLGWASCRFSPKSKLYGWTRAAFGGGPIDRGYNLNTDDLIGRKVTLTVLASSRDDGTEFNKIDAVKTYRNGQAAAAAVPSVEPEPVF